MSSFIYLHGFASGRSSSKAQFFARKFAELGIQLEIPELDEGRFETLTISSQLAVIERAARGGPACLLGSSMGGWLAALFASQHPQVERLVLMAPAFGFVSRLPRMMGEETMAQWNATGTTRVFHYATGKERSLGYALVDDARRYPEYPDVSQPTLILHGSKDETVPLGNSVRFASAHPNVRLVEFDSGHELTDVLDGLWSEAAAFLGLGLP